MRGRVSIILPNYNHAPYLKERLDSIFGQTYQDFEVIILDDASTDDSLNVLNTYKNHPKVSHFIINRSNSGSPFKQWKKGLELAMGDYIWIAESDDFADLDFLEKTVPILERETVALVYSDSRIVNERSLEIGTWSVRKNKFFKTDRWSNAYINNGKDEVLDFLFYKITINNASAVLFNKKEFMTKGFLNELSQYKNLGDVITYMHFALKGDIAYIPLLLNNYREHDHNATLKNTKEGIIFKERILCYLDTYKVMDALGLTKADRKKVNSSFKAVLMKNGFSLVDFGHIKEFNCFIRKAVEYKYVSTIEAFLYQLLYFGYGSKNKFLKKISRKIIKWVLLQTK